MFWFTKDKEKIQKGKKNNVFNTETLLPISEIRGDTIILKDWWIRAILKVTWVNIDLRNGDEQQVIVEQYKKFLSWLDFPLQIFIRNNYLELSDYITYMKKNVSKIDHWLLKDQGDGYVSFLEDINSKQWLIYTKEFYVIIPYYPMEEDSKNVRKPRWQKFMNAMSTTETPEKIVDRYRTFLKNNKYLDTRVNVVAESLKWVWMYSKRLWMKDIISLLFKCYNPDAHKDQSVFIR